MTLENIKPTSFDWDNLDEEHIEGETGYAIMKAQTVGTIKLRRVEYSKNYLADHWCEKGHIVFVISGQLIIEHKDHSKHILNSGTTYVVGDNSMPHKALSILGSTVLILD